MSCADPIAVSGATCRLVVPVAPGEEGYLATTVASLLGEGEITLLPLGLERATVVAALGALAKVPQVAIAPTAVGAANPWAALLATAALQGTEGEGLLMVRPGIEAPAGLVARFALAASRSPRLALLSPLNDGGALFALFSSAPTAPLSVVDAWLQRHAPRQEHVVPALFPGASYLSAAALARLRPQSADLLALPTAEAAHLLVTRLAPFGLNAALVDHVYVVDRFPGRAAELATVGTLADSRLIAEVHPLTGLRHAARDAQGSGRLLRVEPSPAPKPVQLHIAHSWGGGLNRWVQSYCEADTERENLVLRSIGTWGAFGKRIALYQGAQMDRPLRYWDLSYPIRATATSHPEYAALLREVIADYGVEAIIISSLIGHALDALASELPTLFLAHDFYPFCPAVVTEYDGICTQCALPRLTACTQHNPQNRFFSNVLPEEWLTLRQGFERQLRDERIRFVAPSPSVIDHWRSLLPALASRPMGVIGHGTDFSPPRLSPPTTAEPLRVVLLGDLVPQKGLALMEPLLERLDPRIELYLVGAGEEGERFARRPRVTVISRYRHAELFDHLAAIQPHVGLLLSVWPETFSYTLSELWLLGLPVVATRVGSFADRIEEGHTGLLCAPNAQAVAECLAGLLAAPEQLRSMWETVARFRHRSLQEMVADYHRLLPLSPLSAPRYYALAERAQPGAEAERGERALYVNPQAPFSAVVLEFEQLLRQKLLATPRLAPWQKRLSLLPLSMAMRIARGLARIRRRS